FQLSSQMWRLKKPLIFGPVGGGNFPPKAFREYFGSAWRREKTRMATSNLLLRFNRSTRRTAQRAAVVLVTNSDTRDMAERIKAGNVEIFLDTGLPAAFFPDEMPPRENQGALKILWVGRMMPRKGLPIVLEALAKVKPEFPFTLTILGGGYLEHTVRPLIKKLHLEDRVDWRGQVPWEEVRKAYLTHHVFMFCSLH